MNTLTKIKQPTEDLELLKSEFQRLKTVFDANPYPELTERRQLIKQLKDRLLQHEQALYQALNQDYGYRSEFDSLLADIMPSVQQLNYVYKKLPKWLKARTSSFRLGVIAILCDSALSACWGCWCYSTVEFSGIS